MWNRRRCYGYLLGKKMIAQWRQRKILCSLSLTSTSEDADNKDTPWLQSELHKASENWAQLVGLATWYSSQVWSRVRSRADEEGGDLLWLHNTDDSSKTIIKKIKISFIEECEICHPFINHFASIGFYLHILDVFINLYLRQLSVISSNLV